MSKKTFVSSCLVFGLMIRSSTHAEDCPPRRFSGVTIQNVSDTKSSPFELSYYDSKMNHNGLVVYGANTADGREIRVAVPTSAGSFEKATVADTKPGSQYSSLGNTSIDDRNNVAFLGTSTNPGIWQGSVAISSTGKPVVGFINEVINQGSSTLNTYLNFGSSAGSVYFRARDSSSPTPFAFSVYKASFNTVSSTYDIQNVDTATNIGITAIFSLNANNRGDFVVRGAQTLPDPPFSREAMGVVIPDDPARNALVSAGGDNIGGFTNSGFSGTATISSDSQTIVSIVNIGGAQRTAVSYNGFDSGGSMTYVPYVMASTSNSELLLINETAIHPDRNLAAWKSTLDGGVGDIIQVGSTDPTSGQPVLDIARTGRPLAGAGLESTVKALALSPEGWSGGDLNQLVFTATLQDNTQVVALVTLIPDPAAQPSKLPGPVPVGAERQVNTTTMGDQKDPAVAMADNGSFVVTWASISGGVSSIMAQRYDATGLPQGSEIAVATATTPEVVSEPDVAVNPATGRFALAWKLGNEFSVNAQARYYLADGTPATDSMLVVGGPAGTTSGPSIAASNNRYAVVASTSSGPEGLVFFRLYDGDGGTVTFPFPVNTTPPTAGTKPSVTIDRSDVSTVAWLDAAGKGVKRQVNESGTALGDSETPVSDQTLAGAPRINANSSGDLVVTQPITDTFVTGGPLSYSYTLRQFDESSQQIGDQVQFNETAVHSPNEISVALDDQGTAAGVWLGACRADIRANWIQWNGTVPDGEYALTDSKPGQRGQPDIAVNGSGQAAVVYRTDGQDGDAGAVYRLIIDPQRNVLGGEFPVNATTEGDQNQPAIAASDAGDLVATYVISGSMVGDVMYRRLDADGRPLSPEIPVNTTPGANSNPDVARNATGTSGVVWQNDGTDVWMQFYDANGLAVGPNHPVNQTPTGKASRPSIALDSNGSFYVVWDRATAPEIVGRRFDASGAPLAGEVPLNTTSDGSQSEPSIGMNESQARIVACWGGANVVCRVLDLDGHPITPEFQANTTTAGDQGHPVVAVLPDGFAVAFTSTHQDSDIISRCFDYNGTPLGPEVQVNLFSPGLQAEPTIDADSIGNHVIGWTSFGRDGSLAGVYAQWFNADGSRQGNEFRLNSTVDSSQSQPAIALTPGGRIAALWTSFGQDGDGDGVFGRMFTTALVDLDRDNVPQGCDLCSDTAPGTPVDPNGCPLRFFGDADGDGDVDGDDLEAFVRCALESGPSISADSWNCRQFDFDVDEDIDQGDFGAAQACQGGEDVPIKADDPDCNPIGACCLPDGSCVLTSRAACLIDYGGEPHHSVVSSCEDVTCPQVMEAACCLPDGSCVETYPNHCRRLGGNAQTNFSCGEVTCQALPVGACCDITTGACLDLRQDDCVKTGGIPRAPGTDCVTTQCP